MEKEINSIEYSAKSALIKALKAREARDKKTNLTEAVTFVDNHDVNRITSTLRVPDYIYNVYTLLYTMPGVPSIYYGSEFGIKGVKGKL